MLLFQPSESSWPPSLSHPAATTSGVIPRTRDEGDGRSMTDSQYSGYSPNGQPPPSLLPKQPQSQSGLAQDGLSAKMSFLSVAEEGSSEAAGDSNSISVAGLKPRDIADYINQELRSPSTEHRKGAQTKPPSDSKKLPANTMHPHRVWSRTASGGLQYTGMLSSDC